MLQVQGRHPARRCHSNCVGEMAKFVIAGRAACSSYARAEMLADTLAAHLPHFKVTKMVHSSVDWPGWVKCECRKRGWSHSGESPLVWRELVDTGGKGLYLGGLKEFEEYALHYYNISPSTESELENKIAAENQQTFQQCKLEEQKIVPKLPVKVFLSNEASALTYHLAQLVATGEVLGKKQRVAIHLYQSQSSSIGLSLAMELQDLGSPLLDYVRVTKSLEEACAGVSLAFILDHPHIGYHYLNKSNSSTDVKNDKKIMDASALYSKYAKALDNAANKNAKVIISGCFANTGAAVMVANASSLLPSSIVAAPCLAESQAKAILANRLGLNSCNITQLVVWGRTHGAVCVDHSFTRVSHYLGAVVGPDLFTLPLSRCEFDLEWLNSKYPALIEIRHHQLNGYRKEGPALVEAVGLARLGQSWMMGDKGEWHSVGVISDGNIYQIPKGIAFSIPCQYKNGQWEPVPGLELTSSIKDKIASQVDQLQFELEVAMGKVTKSQSS